MLDWENLEQYREDQRLEAKKAQGGLPESIWESYSAFANAEGGLILLGVIEKAEDKRFASVPLCDPDQLAADFWNTLTTPGTVSVNILEPEDVRVVESEGNRIVAIHVPAAEARQKPVYIGADPRFGTYVRRGEGDYRCTFAEVAAMQAAAKI